MNQTQILRQMTGEQRLDQALSLSDLVRELAIKNIINSLGKKTTLRRVQKELRQRLRET